MEQDLVASGGMLVLALLVALRVPIGFAMGLVGVGGFAVIVGVQPALGLLAESPIRTATNYNFGLIPLFILMGTFAAESGMSRELFEAGRAWLGNRRGGVAMGTITACGGFAAICGSSLATAAAMSHIAIPEMRALGYGPRLSCGVVAAGGTLGIMIPPSLGLALYGIIVEQDIGALFMAGILPGILAVLLYLVTLQIVAWAAPEALPGRISAVDWQRRWRTLRGIWPMLLLFAFVIGGLYGGVFATTEAAGMGAAGAWLIAIGRGRMPLSTTLSCLITTLRMTASVFAIVIGAIVFGYFLAITEIPQNVAAFIGALPIGTYGKLAVVLALFVALGCVLDVAAMVLLLVPIVYPLILELGFDPIWFGVVVVMTIELGLITPPFGMNVFVIKAIVPDVGLGDMYRGVAPFIVTDLVRLVILVAFPALSLILPQTMY